MATLNARSLLTPFFLLEIKMLRDVIYGAVVPADIEIEISGEKSIVRDVPEMSWDDLRFFWPSVARSLVEVFLGGSFKPYSVRKDRKDGLYASMWYWKQSSENPKEYPLGEAKRFIEMLLEKEYFTESSKDECHMYSICIMETRK
ncbi:MAG: hypothetical protein HXS44_14080 [Theionarchaea archaeon]|nr:hypothetical protein [Theionarchaea archaeon]